MSVKKIWFFLILVAVISTGTLFAQTYFYTISTGLFEAKDDKGQTIWSVKCYAGAPGHINNPDSVFLISRGPLPPGVYYLTQIIQNNEDYGPDMIVLTPDKNTNMEGRYGFLIHGENKANNRTASTGCIIMEPSYRKRIVSHFYDSGSNLITLNVKKK